MKKDFLTVTPDSGSGNATVTVVASENIGGARSTSIKISGGGIEPLIPVNKKVVLPHLPHQMEFISSIQMEDYF